jgi:hypothetical protein
VPDQAPAAGLVARRPVRLRPVSVVARRPVRLRPVSVVARRRVRLRPVSVVARRRVHLRPVSVVAQRPPEPLSGPPRPDPLPGPRPQGLPLADLPLPGLPRPDPLPSAGLPLPVELPLPVDLRPPDRLPPGPRPSSPLLRGLVVRSVPQALPGSAVLCPARVRREGLPLLPVRSSGPRFRRLHG